MQPWQRPGPNFHCRPASDVAEPRSTDLLKSAHCPIPRRRDSWSTCTIVRYPRLPRTDVPSFAAASPFQQLYRQFFLVYLCRRQLLCVVLQLDIRTGYGIGGQPRQWKRQLLRPLRTISGSDSVHVRQGVRSEFLIWCFLRPSMQPRPSPDN